MKLLIASPDALYDSKTGKPFKGIFEALDFFLSVDEANTVVVVSVDKNNLKDIDEKYNPIPIAWKFRGSPKLVEELTKILKCEYSDVLILGCKDPDVYTASNSKTLLLRADYAINNNPTSKIYVNGYGLQIQSPQGLKVFFDHYFTVKTPWFYKLEVDEKTTLYALTEANTIDKGKAYKEICSDFKACLKSGNDTYLYPFTIYFLISTYMIFKEMATIDYWALYPSSTGEANDDMEFFLRKARQSYGGKNPKPLFIRHSESEKRHHKSNIDRVKDGCKSQFDSIILNPEFKDKLKGRDVCVIDDFTTYGSSCETVRHLLTEAGVNKIIFIALGKFGHNYCKYNYELKGDLFSKYEYKEIEPYKSVSGDKNMSSNMDFLLSINKMK